MRARPVAALFVYAALAGLIAPASAQQGAPLSGPAACTKAGNDWRAEQLAPAQAAYQKAVDSNRAALLAKYSAASRAAVAGVQKMATDCAAKFSVATFLLASSST